MVLPLFDTPRPLLADGAMATTLFARGLQMGACPEAWTISHPDLVGALHRDFVAAGADILLTNSFGGHPWRLRTHGLATRATELNRAAARLARAATDGAGRPVAVAGAVGPTGEPHPPAAAAHGFATQMEALKDGGVDLLWIETMSFAAEIRMAAEAAAAVGLPYVLTASFGHDRRTLGGLDAAAFARLAADLPVPPRAIGANCGTDAEAVLRDLVAMRVAAAHLPLVFKPSAGLPEMRHGQGHYPMSPADMGAAAVRAVALGTRIVGGCCGTTPGHLAAMRAGVVAAPALASTAAPS